MHFNEQNAVEKTETYLACLNLTNSFYKPLFTLAIKGFSPCRIQNDAAGGVPTERVLAFKTARNNAEDRRVSSRVF